MNLTPRVIYTSIKCFLTPRLKFTLSSFWWDFLSSSIPGSILDPFFEIKPKRPRSLTPMMTCSKPGSFPKALHKYLEENLNPEDFLSTVKWLNDVLDQKADPEQIYKVITSIQDNIDEGSAYLSLPEVSTEGSNRKKLFMDSVRLTWLGFCALYHDRDHTRLMRLMQDEACLPDHLWTAYTADPNTIRTIVATPTEVIEWLNNKKVHDEVQCKNDGWYVVANWTDLYICMNDRPLPNYEGSNVLAEIPNGTVLFVTNTEGYHGLHCSTGQWGKTSYNGSTGFVPLNLMQKLLIE